VGTLPPGCAYLSGSGTPIFTIGCAIASLGMPAGTTFTEAVAGVPAGTPFVTYAVTYNANGAAPQVPTPVGPGLTNCTALPAVAGGTATCTNTPFTQTVSGGTLTMTVSLPPSSAQTMQITGVSPAGLGSCYVSSALPQPAAPGSSGTVTITCASGQSTANPPTPITLTVTAGTTVSGGPTVATTNGSCSGVNPAITCTNTPGQVTAAGGSLTLTLVDPAPHTVTTNPPPATAGTCPESVTSPAGEGTNTVTVTYICGAGQSASASAISVTGVDLGLPGLNTAGVCTPAGGPPPFTCSNTPAEATASGGTLTLVLADPTFVISAASPSPTAGSCLLAGPPAGLGSATVTVTYACGNGQTAPAAPIAITGIATTDATGAMLAETTNTTGQLTETTSSSNLATTFALTETTTSNANGPQIPPGSIVPVPEVLTIGTCTAIAGTVGATGTCSNVPGEVAQPGQQVVLAITGAVGQTIEATAAAPQTGNTCDPNTLLPTSTTGPEGTVTVVYACTVMEPAMVPETSGAPTPPGFVVTVASTNGVAGTPNEVTSIITQGPPTPGIPAPATSNLTFQVCGVAVTCPLLTTTPTAATGTPGTSTPVPSTSTPTSTATPLGAGGSCSSATPVPTGCVTQGTTCVNGANATLPPVPTSGGPAINPNGPYQGYTGEPLKFNGAALPATPALIISCIWTFGDGAFSHYIGATHTYLSAGPFTANLTVTDSFGHVTSLNVPVLIAPLGQLCQQPGAPLGSGLSPACSAAPGCLAASFNNGCQPTCPANGETLLPNQCPGPATNNQVWVNGPFNVGIDQPLTVTVDTNVAPGSTLLPGDVVKFDWGDGQVIYNTPQPGIVPAILFGGTGAVSATSSSTTVPLTVCADQVIVGIVGPTACLNDGGPAPMQFQQTSTAGFNPAFPAPMTSAHGYTQPGTYNLRVTLIFSDGTGATAQTTVTVTGSPASLATAGSFPPPQSAPATAMPLNAGCNSIELTFPDGTAVTTVAGAVTGTTVVSIGETPPNAPPLTWYTTAGVGTNNLVSVQHGDWATICVTGSGVLNQPSS